MLMMNSPDVGFSAEIALLRTLSLGKDRPNVMVMNPHASVDRLVEQLTTVCQAPIQVVNAHLTSDALLNQFANLRGKCHVTVK